MRVMLLAVFALVLLLGAFTTYYFNDKVLTAPEDGFDITDTMAPVGASLPGENGVIFANGIYTLTYSENGNILTQYEIDTNNDDIENGMFSVKEKISELETEQQFYPVKKAGTRYRLRDPLATNPLIWPTNFVQTLNPVITFTHSLSNEGIIELRYREIIERSEQVNIEKRYLLSIKGKTLVLQVEALNPPPSPFGYYQDFVFDSNVMPNNPSPSNIALSYAEWAPITIAGPLNNRYYQTIYFDYTKSNSNSWPWLRNYINSPINSYMFAYTPSYSEGIAGNYNSLSETFYITLSKNINDVIPKINRPAPQYRSELNNRIPLELWRIYMPAVLSSTAERPFERARTQVIDVLKSYGLEDLLVTLTAWRHRNVVGTCGDSGPIAYPAESSWGGSEKMLELSRVAQSYGYLFGLYQIHTDMYDTGLWQPENLLLNRAGDWVNYGWTNTNCPPTRLSPRGNLISQPLIIKPDKWMHYAQLDTPNIKQDYEVSSVFLDVHPKLLYPTFIDYDLGSSVTAKSPKIINQIIDSLLTYLRSQVNGPIVGEGGSSESYPTDTLHAGYIEGVEGEGVARRINNIYLAPHETPVIPDFELRHIKPLMVRFGMGYANRWTKPEEVVEPKINILTYPWDKYIATQFAFGHSGYLNDEYLYADTCSPSNTECWGSVGSWSGNPTQYERDLAKNTINLFVKQYYNAKAFQELYLSSDILEIKYLNSSGNLVSLSSAIDEGVDFYNPRIYLKYRDGTEVWINRDQALGNVWTVNADGVTYYLPANGWLGINSVANFLEYSALVDNNGNPDPNGYRVDYVRSNDYIMADGRGVETNFGNGFNNVPLISTYFTVVKPNGWTLLEQANRGFQVTSTEFCGNNICGVGETCSSCVIDCRTCAPICGNGIVETEEVCDGGVQSCTINGYAGTQTCSSSCTWNSCTTTLSCGDTFCNGAETCFSCEGDCGTCPNSNPYIESINPNTIINTEFRNVQILGRDFYPRAIEFDGLEYPSFYGWTVSPNRNMINMIIPSGYPGGDKTIRVINTNNVISNAKTLRINYRFNYDLSLSPSSIVLAPGASQEIQAIVNVLPFVGIEEVSFSVVSDPQISYQFVGVDRCTAEPSGEEIKCSIRIILTASPYLNLQTYNVQITGRSLTTNPQTEILDINALPDAPSNLVVVALDSSSLKLDWIDNSNNENGFKLDYKLHSSSSWGTVDLPTPNTETYTHSGLSASTEYDYRVFAYNQFGNSELSNVVSGTTNPGGSSSSSSSSSGGGGGGGGGPPKILMQCNDKKDNDNDTFVDYPYDPGCLNKEDNIELDSVLVNINKHSNSTLKNDSTIDDGDDIQPVEKDKEIRLVFWLTILVLVLGMAVAVIITVRSIRQHKRLKEIYSHVHN